MRGKLSRQRKIITFPKPIRGPGDINIFPGKEVLWVSRLRKLNRFLHVPNCSTRFLTHRRTRQLFSELLGFTMFILLGATELHDQVNSFFF